MATDPLAALQSWFNFKQPWINQGKRISLMKIYLNGKEKTVTGALVLAELLVEMELSGKRIAVEINQEIIPRSEHAAYQLNNNDRVEVIQAIGGG